MSKYVWKGAPEHGGTLAAVRGFLFNHYGCDAVAESACAGSDLRVDVVVCDKHFFRVSNRVSLTVVVATDSSATRVTAMGSGGGASLLWRFDWGAEEDFASSLEEALIPLGFQEG